MEKDIMQNEETQKEQRSLFNPETTFCEGQTYLDFLLSNAKDDEEKAHIEDTINNYLETVDDSEDLEDEEIEEDEE
jgi:hypothetical protein